MSDGPYRSLPMSRAWKRLAQLAENVNVDHTDTAAAAMRALASTWGNEVPSVVTKGVREIFLDREPGLFRDAQIAQAQALSREAAGYGLGRLLTDHAIAVLAEGMHGESALTETVQRALNAYAARAARQIEEHYCRNASGKLTKQVRDRIAGAIATADLPGLAKQCSGLESKTSLPRPAKHTSLDDGVPL
jgi:hypothetical protein